MAHVTIRRRSDTSPDNPGYVLFIERTLYRAIGSPRRIAIKRSGSSWVIKAGMRYSVTNVDQGGEPRISIGKSVINSLKLSSGSYTGHAKGRSITF